MADNTVQIIIEAVARGADKIRDTADRIGEIRREAKGASDALSGADKKALGLADALKIAAGAAAGLAALETGVAGVLKVLNTSAQFEGIGSALTTVSGGAEKAEKAMAWIEEFTAKTPYELDQVAGGFQKLSAYGLDAVKHMGILGDTAAAMGKSIDDAVEMMADASTGEFERLKEFGVRASTAGDQVTFSWMQAGQQMSKTVKKTGADIESGLLDILGGRFGGAMADFSTTWNGMWSNAQDTVTLFFKSIGDAGAFESFKSQLEDGLAAVQRWKEDGTLDEWAHRFSSAIQYGVGVVRSLVEAAGTLAPVFDGIVYVVSALGPELVALAAAAGTFLAASVAMGPALSAIATGMAAFSGALGIVRAALPMVAAQSLQTSIALSALSTVAIGLAAAWGAMKIFQAGEAFLGWRDAAQQAQAGLEDLKQSVAETMGEYAKWANVEPPKLTGGESLAELQGIGQELQKSKAYWTAVYVEEMAVADQTGVVSDKMGQAKAKLAELGVALGQTRGAMQAFGDSGKTAAEASVAAFGRTVDRVKGLNQVMVDEARAGAAGQVEALRQELARGEITYAEYHERRFQIEVAANEKIMAIDADMAGNVQRLHDQELAEQAAHKDRVLALIQEQVDAGVITEEQAVVKRVAAQKAYEAAVANVSSKIQANTADVKALAEAAQKAYAEASDAAQEWADKVAELSEQSYQAQLSGEDKLRELRRKGMGDADAKADIELQAAEKAAAAKIALEDQQFEEARKLNEQAMALQDKLADDDIAAAERRLRARLDFDQQIYDAQIKHAEAARDAETKRAADIEASLAKLTEAGEKPIAITIPNLVEVNNELSELTKPATKRVTVETVEKKQFGGPVGFRAGGRIPGYGGGDRRWILAEDGEFVIRKEAVRAYGSGLFHLLNTLRAPMDMSWLKGLAPRVSAPKIAYATGGSVAGGMADMGVVRVEMGGASYPMMGKVDVIQEFTKAVRREQRRRTNG